MRKTSFEDTFKRFFKHLFLCKELLLKIRNTKQLILKRSEKREIFEGVSLKIYATWEVFTESLLIDCLNHDTSQYSMHTGSRMPKHLSRDVCERLISGLGFFDIKGISHLKGIANDILVPKYNPFPCIQNDDGSKIDEFYTIRRYLAHYSSHSKRKLLKLYKTKYSFRKFCEPGDFLSTFDGETQQIRLLNYTRAFHNASEKMATFLGI